MLTIWLFYSCARIYRSLMTDLTDRLLIILAFDIYFIAKYLPSCDTFHTLPKPPFPMQYKYLKLLLDNANLKII